MTFMGESGRRRTYEDLDAFQLDDGRVMVTLGVPGHRIPEEFVPAAVLAERDRMRRLFNRLEAAITHHKRAEGFPDSHDEALYKARDKILSDYTSGEG